MLAVTLTIGTLVSIMFFFVGGVVGWLAKDHVYQTQPVYTHPGSHTQAIGQFPLTTHVCIDTDQEVEDYELERTTVIQPLVERCGFPDGIEVESNCVGRGNNCTGDDVVTVHE